MLIHFLNTDLPGSVADPDVRRYRPHQEQGSALQPGGLGLGGSRRPEAVRTSAVQRHSLCSIAGGLALTTVGGACPVEGGSTVCVMTLQESKQPPQTAKHSQENKAPAIPLLGQFLLQGGLCPLISQASDSECGFILLPNSLNPIRAKPNRFFEPENCVSPRQYTVQQFPQTCVWQTRNLTRTSG